MLLLLETKEVGQALSPTAMTASKEARFNSWLVILVIS